MAHAQQSLRPTNAELMRQLEALLEQVEALRREQAELARTLKRIGSRSP